MVRLAREDAARVRGIAAELDTVQIGSADVMDVVLPQIRDLIEVEGVLVYAVAPTLSGFKLARWNVAGMPALLRPIAQRMFAATPDLVFYDLLRPEVSQRNRALEATAWIDRDKPGTWAQSAMCRNVMSAVNMQRHKQLRALVCDGPSLLAWFGGVLPDVPTPKQYRLLDALVPAMQRRLSLERRVDTHALLTASLGAAMSCLGAPAFVIDARGTIHEMNDAGRALLAEDGVDVRHALRDSLARRAPAIDVELVEIRESGSASHWLAIVHVVPAVAARVAAVALRMDLTKRQRAVLELVAQGLPNATIAAMLGVGDRAVELHVTALFRRFDVENRAALVARVLG